jgi:hypothetical protein
VAELDLARLESALALVDEHGLTPSGIHHGTLGNGQHRRGTADVDFGIDIHVVDQHQIRIVQFDAQAPGSRLLVDLRIDDVDLPGEFAAGKAAGFHGRRLPHRQHPHVALGHIDDGPDDRMVGDPEQHVARLRPHALDGIALEHDAVARRSPLNGNGNRPAFLDRCYRRIRYVEIHQPLP